MRLYSPEWEAIRDFQYSPKFMDVQFDLEGKEIPEDHGQVLHDALCGLLPWLDGEEGAGVHPIHGAPTGRDHRLVINRRVKLVIRAPVARLGDLKILTGARIDLGAGVVTLGAVKEKALLPFAYLYAPMVDFGTDDEVAFLEAARAELDAMGVQGGLIPGKKRKMLLPEGDIWGFSLMLHDIGLEPSLHVQEQGLGRHRAYGCGVFVPHKSIKEVAAG